MAMTDDERIIEALAKARSASNQIDWGVSGESYRLFARNRAAQQLAALRALGGDVTMPPAPEPTYTIRLTLAQHHDLVTVLGDHESSEARWLYQRIADVLPDPEPGA